MYTLNASRAAPRSALIIDQPRQDVGARQHPVIGIRRSIPLWVEISQGLVVGVGGLLSPVAEGLDISQQFVFWIPDGLSAHCKCTLKLLVEKEM